MRSECGDLHSSQFGEKGGRELVGYRRLCGMRVTQLMKLSNA